MVHFSAIAMIHEEKVVPFSDIIRGTFALTNIKVRSVGYSDSKRMIQLQKDRLL